MKRSEIWIAAGGPDYAGKPRPVVILQDDRYDTTGSITECLMTSERVTSTTRIKIEPSAANSLQTTSYAMADKVTTLARARLGKRIGAATASEMASIERAVTVFLGLASAN